MSDLFISYSRDDRNFVEKLHLSVKESGRDAWLDKFGIEKGEIFWNEIKQAITRANAFVFIITPSSILKAAGENQYCRREIEYAVEKGKRIIPIIWRDQFGQNDDVVNFLDETILAHQELKKRNWLEFHEEYFDDSLTDLFTTSEKDLEYVKLHTKLLEEAQDWSHRRSDSKLRRSDSLIESEEWLCLGEQKIQLQKQEFYRKYRDPEPTEEHRNFIIESRKAEDAQLERERLDREAKEQADKKIDFGTKILAGTLGVAIVAGCVAGYFVDQSKKAAQLQNKAEIGTQLELESKAALELLNSRQTDSLLTALRAGWKLREATRNNKNLEDYPSVSPIFSLSTIINKIQEIKLIGVSHAAYLSDGSSVVTGGSDGVIKIWNNIGQEILKFKGHSLGIAGIEPSPDGKKFITCEINNSDTKSNTARLWDMSGSQIAEFKHDDQNIKHIAYSPDGQSIMTSSDDKIIIWSVSGSKLITLNKFKDNGLISATYSPDGKSFATSQEGGLITIYVTTQRFG